MTRENPPDHELGAHRGTQANWPDWNRRCRGLRIEFALLARDAGLHHAARGMITEVLDELDEELGRQTAHEQDRCERDRARRLLGELGTAHATTTR